MTPAAGAGWRGNPRPSEAKPHPLVATLSMIRFSHTVFALPFALLSAVLAAGGIPPVRTLLLILLAMVGARSAAMSFNRIADRDVDAKNPRTASRELVSGVLSVRFAAVFCAASAAVFVVAVTRAGAVVAPPIPAFYAARTAEEMLDAYLLRVADLLDLRIAVPDFRWTGPR